MLRSPWPGVARSSSKPEPSSRTEHGRRPAARPAADHDHRAPRAGVPAGVGEALLDDAEHLDLLVGSEPHAVLVDLQARRRAAPSAVRKSTYRASAASKPSVARRSPRRARAPRTAPPAGPPRPPSFRRGSAVAGVGAALEHAGRAWRPRRGTGRARRGSPAQPARAPRRPPARTRVGRSPAARQPTSSTAVGQQPQEVARRDLGARPQGREDVMQLGEQGQRRGQREPAVEVEGERPVAPAEADHRDEPEQRVRRQQAGQRERRACVGGGREGGQRRAGAHQRRPRCRRGARSSRRARRGGRARRRRCRPGPRTNAAAAISACSPATWTMSPAQASARCSGLAAELRGDRERDRCRQRRSPRSPAAEQQVEPPSLHHEADPREQRHVATRRPRPSCRARSRSCGSAAGGVAACGWRRTGPGRRPAARRAAARRSATTDTRPDSPERTPLLSAGAAAVDNPPPPMTPAS